MTNLLVDKNILIALSVGGEFAIKIFRMEVSSRNFAMLDRNCNTGGGIATELWHQYQSAVNRISCDARHPSHILSSIKP
jgi:predicted acyl esterase